MIAEPTYGEATYGGGDLDSEASSWVEMSGAIGDAMPFGPSYYTDENGDIIVGPGIGAVPLSMEVVPRNDFENVDTTSFDETFARSFLDEHNDVGSGQLSYANTDTAARDALALDVLITFVVWGYRAWSMLLESQTRVAASQGEEHDQVTTVMGRGHLAITDESVLYPSRGTGILPIEEDRTFNWSTPTPVYDDSGWARAYQICTVATAQTIWPHQPFVEGWPSRTTGVIWAPGSTHLYAPAGFCYFRHTFTLSSAGWYLLYAACDNRGELWLDGQQVLNLGTFTQSFSYEVYMTAGDHTVAIRGLNYTGSDGVSGQGPAAVVFALYTQDENGEPDTRILESGSDWKIVAYPPSPPGMYVGEVLHTVFDEAWARSELEAVELMFSETTDSAGQPWPETVNIATKVGTSYLTFLLELTATYIDVWMKPASFELYAWNKDTRPAPSGLVLYAPTDPDDPSSGNILEQAHTRLV